MNKKKEIRLIDRIREPDPMRPAFGRGALRLAIRQALKASEKAQDAPILSEEKTADVLIKRYSAIAVSHRATGILDEEQLQDQLEWYRVMVPWIVKTEFNRMRKRNNNSISLSSTASYTSTVDSQ